MTVALAIPPLTVKNRPRALIRACAFNRKNTVIIIIIMIIIIILTRETPMASKDCWSLTSYCCLSFPILRSFVFQFM